MSGHGSFWPGRRVFVTGATGFVGSWLVNALLERGAQVVALIRDMDAFSWLVQSGASQRITIVQGRLEDYASVERAVNEHEAEIVFHLGAQALVGAALRSPLPTFESNIRGTYHVLEACRVHADLVKAVVIASSDKAYGDTEDLPYTEAHPLVGKHPYDVSKSCTDLLAASYYHTYEMPVAIARCGNIYGGGDLNWSRIIPGTIRSFHQGERPIIRSDGTLVRDYFYVEDAVKAYLALAEQASGAEVAGHAFNFSNEIEVSVLDLVESIRKAMQIDGLEPVVQGGGRGEIQAQTLCAKRARDVLGWKAEHDLPDGISRTIDWYRSFLQSTSG